MKTTKKAVRKAAKAREQSAAAKIVPPTPAQVEEYAPGGPRPAPDMMPPPVLYKYAPPDTPDVKSIEQAIADRRVYFSSPTQFNDPFDCRAGLDVSDSDTMRRLSRFLRGEVAPSDIPKLLDSGEVSRARYAAAIARAHRKRDAALFGQLNMGVCCLTERPDSALMWAHYARSHEGVCLEIAPYQGGKMERHPLNVAYRSDPDAFPFEMMQPVSYGAEYLTCPLGDGPEGFEVFFRKSEDWEHEKEWRALMPDTSKPQLSGGPPRMRGSNSAYPLGKNRLTGVILGFRMSRRDKRRVVHMAKEAGIAIREALPKYSEYGIKIVPYEESSK